MRSWRSLRRSWGTAAEKSVPLARKKGLEEVKVHACLCLSQAYIQHNHPNKKTKRPSSKKNLGYSKKPSHQSITYITSIYLITQT